LMSDQHAVAFKNPAETFLAGPQVNVLL